MSLSITVTDESQAGPSGPITGWDLDWGDSTSHASGPGPWNHTYAEAGTYTIVLTVTGTSPDTTDVASQATTVAADAPPDPPPATGDAWAWDATAADVRSDSAEVIPIFVAHGGPFAYFAAEVAVGEVSSHSSGVYEVATAGKPGGPFDADVWFPNGVQPGVATDGHLAIHDTVTDRWHNFEIFGKPIPSSYFSGGKIVGWTGGDSMPAGAVQEPRGGGAHGGATVAKFPLLQGLITIDDVISGTIEHALVCTMTNCGPAPNPYPSNSGASYSGPNVAMDHTDWEKMPAPGTWLEVDPAANISALSGFEHMVMLALQDYGTFVRDRSTDFTLHGADPMGGGASRSDWIAAGVNLNANMQIKFSSTFISLLTSHLRVLVAPSP